MAVEAAFSSCGHETVCLLIRIEPLMATVSAPVSLFSFSLPSFWTRDKRFGMVLLDSLDLPKNGSRQMELLQQLLSISVDHR